MPKDKLLHFIAGTVVMFTLGLLHPAIGLAACGVASWLKEEWDARRPATHTYDGWDAYATMLGTIPGYALLLAWASR